jgi:serine/threonine protein phosphatase PrpC
VTPRPTQNVSAPDRTGALYKLLRQAPRDRLVAPGGHPFAFATHRGKVRKDNQDTALVLAGRRATSSQTFLAAILCDGMGGLDAGDEAADLAAASAGAALARDERLAPVARMDRAIRGANAAVFERFRGRAGTVLVAVLVEAGQAVIGWVGDARAYGLVRGREPERLTEDDTVATAIARIEGAAPDAMDALLRAIGQKPTVEPNLKVVEPGPRALLLVSDGVHRIEPAALAWVCRHAQSSTELVERLRAAASWEGGVDNATALVLELGESPSFGEDGVFLAAWVEAQPRTWEIAIMKQSANSRSASQVSPVPALSARQEPVAVMAPKRKRERTVKRGGDRRQTSRTHPEQVPLAKEPGAAALDSKGERTTERGDDRRQTSRARPEQVPLTIELGGISEDKP